MPRDEFELEVLPDGKVDIRRNGRGFFYEEEDVDFALLRVRREIGRDKDVTVIEQDGYRVRRRT